MAKFIPEADEAIGHTLGLLNASGFNLDSLTVHFVFDWVSKREILQVVIDDTINIYDVAQCLSGLEKFEIIRKGYISYSQYLERFDKLMREAEKG